MPNSSASASSSAAITPFDYDGTQVRTILIDGEPWFVLADLCKVLEIANAKDVKDRLDPDGVDQTYLIDSMGRQQSATIINEANMYEVVLRSDKPEAVPFRRWVTGTVLPSIRKTNSYSTAPALSGSELLARAVLEAQGMLEQKDALIGQQGQQIGELTRKAEVDAPKVGYVDTFVADADLISIRTIASTLNVQETWLRELLIRKRWIYAETTTRYSETKGRVETITRYSAYADKKQYFQPVKNHQAPRFRGETMHSLKATPLGAEAIARLVKRENGG